MRLGVDPLPAFPGDMTDDKVGQEISLFQSTIALQ